MCDPSNALKYKWIQCVFALIHIFILKSRKYSHSTENHIEKSHKRKNILIAHSKPLKEKNYFFSVRSSNERKAQ